MSTNFKQPLVPTDIKSDTQQDNGNCGLSGTEVSLQHLQQEQYPIQSTTNDVSTITQIRLITWKNYKTQIARHKCAYCCKMCCPLFFILIMGFVAFGRPFMTEDINCNYSPCPQIYIAPQEQHNLITATDLTVNNPSSFIPQLICNNFDNWWFQPGIYPAYIAIVWPDIQYEKSHVQSVLNIIASHYGSGQTCIFNQTIGPICPCYAADISRVNFTNGSLLQYFNSESELNSYIRDNNYAQPGWNFNNNNPNALRPIAAGIVFKSVSENGKIWDYSLRLNQSLVPATFSDNELQIVDRFTRDSNQLLSQSVNQYIPSFFLELQSIIDNAITEYIAVNISNLPYDNIYTSEYNKGYFVFPFTYYETDIYWSIMGIPFTIFVTIMFIYPIIKIVSILVTEKSNKIKEGMKMMGLLSYIYWISMYFWFIIEFTIICAFITGFGFLMNVFEYSDSLIIILWFWLFCMTQIAFNTLISTFFDNPKTAIIVAFVLYFCLVGLAILMETMSETQKIFFCLLATPCMIHSLPIVATYESAMIGIQWDNIFDVTSQFKFSTVLIMMFVDCILYILLTIYFDNVWPSRFGQKKSMFFCCFTSFWKSKTDNKKQKHNNNENDKQLLLHNINIKIEPIGNRHNYEEIDEKQYGQPVISVRNLSKTFNSLGLLNNAKVKAVQKISLDIYRGEIFCLLGHNGAGKTTTISMLSGLISATDGNAWINGYDINNNMNKIRKWLGVCPQHDILWDVLTAEEHLKFFAKLKGVESHNLQYEVNRIINLFNMLDTGLWGKFPPNMSGGEKRRLSLAIALIGGSPLVFLDEPTSGMDPENRRKVWDIIQKEKKSRCIILTTHYMNEADVLGDRIAIMSDGVIKCCGSSLYLKRLYGVGYTFTVSLKESDNDNSIKPKIDNILDEIHNVQTVSMAASEIIYRLPFEASSQFAEIFTNLDNNKRDLNIKTFGISVTTLEEVFIKIGNDSNAASNESMMQLENSSYDTFNNEQKHNNDINSLINEEKNIKFEFKQEEFKLENKNIFWIFFVHIYAILYKRFWWSIRDVKGIICQIILPVVLVGILFGLMNPIQVSQKELSLKSDQWSPEYTNEIIVPLSNLDSEIIGNVNNLYYTEGDWSTFYVNNMQNTFGENRSYDIGNETSTCFSTNPNQALCTQEFQINIYNSNKNKDIIPYNGFYFYPYLNEVLLGINASAYHSLPITLNTWNNWVLKKQFNNDGITEINIYSEPFPLTKQEESQINQGEGLGTAINLMIAFTLIPASSIYFVVNEKTIGTKHQQFVSGISISSYWVGTYISDILLGIPASSLVIAAIYIFDYESLKNDATLPLFCTLILFVSSSIAAGYLLHFFFKSPGKSQFITIIFNILLGVIFLTVSFVLGGVSQASSTAKDFKAWVSILPIFLLGDNILQIITKPLSNPDKNYFEVIDTNLYYMLAESIGYFVLVLLIEYAQSFPSILSQIGFVVDQPRKFQRLDDDVIREQKRIKTGLNNNSLNDTVILAGLRKVYKGENKMSPYKPAVRDMYFGVPQGEIFGFLGTNGAGKTSTLNLLTGQIYPSDGTAYINGLSLNNQLDIRRVVGFCPQNDALFDLLTGKEHLKFYALLKGLWNKKELISQTNILLNALTLNKYSNRTSVTYSGGCKRKLCVAQAMIGNPPVVFLDEPSTGMDPVSRRRLWQFINTTMEGRCVILTTHSMEECEALCHRVGIMVNGQLSCIGSPQHLKSKFGKGYQLDLTLKDNNELDDNIHKLLEELNEIFPTSVLEQNNHKLLLEIKQYQAIIFENDDEKKSDNNNQLQESSLSILGKMFKIIEDIKMKYGIISYALSQTSLEQIFLKMAKNKGVTEERIEDNINDKQKELLVEIQNESKDELIKRLIILNRDHLQQILQNEIKNGSSYILRALDIKKQSK